MPETSSVLFADRLQNDRRLVRRYERKADHFHAFADLGYALLCYRQLTKNNHLE
ncbi:hypothetical protein [Micromonospora pisi]|uniref:hypothetical protein n=1 Tax=Micromonospora pisi TaxID=589240 RepID=UPI0014770F4F|nr:hypothetical protein [Micromonospora pisi]